MICTRPQTVRPLPFIARGVISLLIALNLVAGVWLAAAAQGTPVPVEGNRYPLPRQWQGAATVSVEELGQVAPPLQVVESVGDFRFSLVPAEGGDILRILPDGESETPGQYLRLMWPLTRGDAELPAGATAALTAQARAFSPPDGVVLTIGESEDGERWTSSSVRINQVQWSDYSVLRTLSDTAQAVQFGLEWRLENSNAWLEIRDLHVTVLPPAAEGSPYGLSATDTPTLAAPVATATLTGTPTPVPATASPATPTPIAVAQGDFIVVTSTPTPADVFAAATQAAMMTEWAQVLGPATATPENLATPTHTPTPIVVTNTPAPGNAATATHAALWATAVAFTTGTPTPFPAGAAVLVATDTPAATAPTPRPAMAAKTSTPVFVYVEDLFFPTSTPTPEFPSQLVGKILFLSPYLATNANRPNAFMVNPDGTGLALMTSREFYDRAKERDAYSADKRFYAYALREPLGGRSGVIQIYWDDAEYGSTGHQLTYFGVGTAWGPAFSPAHSDMVALVSSESKNDEIWLAQRNQWPAVQLTRNEWEWDRSPSFSPDGTQIVFESNRATGTRQLWVMDASGQNQRQITNFPFETWNPVWVKYVED